MSKASASRSSRPTGTSRRTSTSPRAARRPSDGSKPSPKRTTTASRARSVPKSVGSSRRTAASSSGNGAASSARGSEARAVRVWFPRGRIAVELGDGRQVSTPLSFYPTLAAATPRERGRWTFLGPGMGIEWPGLDLQLSTQSIVHGRREHIPPKGWAAGLEKRLREFRGS